ncbi:MAG TPA: carboxypeptidase-like regulatory domain-containing protein, partial [Candidatus Angelobacter sp.]|nr:carboxypeptidase-like regulatory domain-containing protein [Candidatus Angelobacter sp.]
MYRSLAIAFITAAALAAQAPQGELRLTIKDPTGAAMQATGSLTGPTTKNFQTDPQGNAAVTNLLYGHYQLQLSSSGFTPQTLQLDIDSATPVARTVTMALAA